MTAAKEMHVIARLPGCAGQATDAVSAHTQVDVPRLLKRPLRAWTNPERVCVKDYVSSPHTGLTILTPLARSWETSIFANQRMEDSMSGIRLSPTVTRERLPYLVQDLAILWIQSYPCKNKISQETDRSLRKFLGKAKSHLHWQFLGAWQSLWRIILESLYIPASPFRDQCYCWKSGTQKKGRNFCSAVAIRLGWKKVGIFHVMLLLSAKCSTPLVRRWNTLWTAIWRTIPRTSNSIWCDARGSFCFRQRQVNTPPVWWESFTGVFLGYALYAGRNLERRHFRRRHRGAANFGRVRNPCAKAQRKGSANPEKKVKSVYSQAQMVQKVVWKRTGNPKIHFNPGLS